MRVKPNFYFYTKIAISANGLYQEFAMDYSTLHSFIVDTESLNNAYYTIINQINRWLFHKHGNFT